jgi:hypothetical protein
MGQQSSLTKINADNSSQLFLSLGVSDTCEGGDECESCSKVRKERSAARHSTINNTCSFIDAVIGREDSRARDLGDLVAAKRYLRSPIKSIERLILVKVMRRKSMKTLCKTREHQKSKPGTACPPRFSILLDDDAHYSC